ncbi:16S rRNA (adenine(1518)-N(6)/adenine(1519)-N(6))-dimethyltransferase RsmA [Roseibacillus ishigakijimensis]|uniref:Ribosomal RNA small subunit methyltransferase A n=1 Tax=Roseibacillus ishigakijimensis TaxID=454146 RepID=A0A934VIN2_9BACT|nr:16S rRNA (adenine(1518)-N(6)/adenine(1519)-N(6))-dimethyltransferase RsmA [Roseibacillus ishigakijimensis]MBK1835248.1 ribosomal RNA small subunit methyltransferase A [Roseibacillus ishigakijimensis]
MTLPELKVALEATGVTPSRKLGQNFLHDANVARWIGEQLDPQPEDCIVEVGPGTGALSEHLVGKVRKLVLVEYDQRLAQYLTEKFADEPSVEVHSEDGARFDIRPLWAEGPVKMLGNLPYSAGGAILRNFLKSPTPVDRAVIMLQKEVIDRILAEPRTKAYGVLTLRMQSEWDSAPIKTIGPECFHPRPLIDSTVMMCRRRAESLPVYDRRLFDELIRRGFAQRRKMLRKAMPDSPPWPEVAEKVGCSETARAEELSLPQWVELTRCYDETLAAPAQSDDEVFDVVDEQNIVTGQATRAEVHEKNLLHRAVHVLVVNGKSEVLLQQRSRLKDQQPGKWGSSAAGHLDAGEDYEACARRELGEELGIETEDLPLKLVGEIPASEENGWEFIQLYVTVYSGVLRFPANEVEAVEWLGQEALRQWLRARPEDFSGGFKECWQLLESQS